MSLTTQSFQARRASMGDAAESAFEATYPNKFERYGLDRAEINLRNVPPMIRFSPDYLTARSFVEVQGFGEAQQFKLKDSKLEALRRWDAIFAVRIFIWDSWNSRYGWMELDDLDLVLHERGRADAFDGGRNPYRWLYAHDLPLSDGWHHYPTRNENH